MMKITALMVLSVLAVSNIAAADEFMPRKLEITGWDEIRFRHDLDKQEILVRVTGGDATVFFAVFSKDEYDNIGNINSNYMPWHTVNKIDTCVYISPPYFMTEGDHVIEWDGRSSEGEVLHYGNPRHGKPSFCYYYLWGVDTNSRKQLVSRDIQITSGGGIIQTQDYEGDPIAQPLFYPSADAYTAGAAGIDSVTITRSRWPIGADPLDTSAIEQTWYKGGLNWAERGPIAFSPYAPEYFYTTGYDLRENFGVMRRFQWHTGGEAKWDNPWGEAGMVIFSSEYPQINLRDPGAVYIGDDLLLAGARNSQGEYGSKLPLIDAVDGYIVNTIVPNQWWQPSPYNDESDVVIESIQYQIVHGWPFTIMGNHLESLFILINPHDPDQDWLRYSVEPLELQEQTVKGIPAIDQQGFAVLPGMGEDSDMVGLLAPDGTWAGMLTLVGEESPRNMMLPVDYGSAYDGMYFDGSDGDSASSDLWYRGYDAFRGLIDMGQGWTYLEVITPNGGEVIPAGSTYTIETYHSTPWGNSIVYLKYSLDNGNSWALIDSMWVSEGEFSYSWSVPNVLADSCRIRAETYFMYPVPYDVSDAPFSIVGPLDTAESQPQAFTIFPASPNPFNPSTAIEFILPEESPVTVTIYNTLGQRVERLHDGVLGAGRHRVLWDAADFGPGLYFYRVETSADVKTGKMMLVK